MENQEIDVDIDSLCGFSFQFENLKKIITYLVNKSKIQENSLNEVNTNIEIMKYNY